MSKPIISISMISENGDYDVVLYGQHCEHHKVCHDEEKVIAAVSNFLGMKAVTNSQHTPTGNEELNRNRLRASKGEVKSNGY